MPWVRISALALLISAHFLINGGVIKRLGLMGQSHWRLFPLCQISPAVISFTFPGCWAQTERSTHRVSDEAPGTKTLSREFCFHDCAKKQTLNVVRSSKWCFSCIHGIIFFFARRQAKKWFLCRIIPVKWCQGTYFASANSVQVAACLRNRYSPQASSVLFLQPDLNQILTLLWQLQSFKVFFPVVFKV